MREVNVNFFYLKFNFFQKIIAIAVFFRQSKYSLCQLTKYISRNCSSYKKFILSPQNVEVKTENTVKREIEDFSQLNSCRIMFGAFQFLLIIPKIS